uniref:RNA helicase n=1 Tax=Ditylenchus dipsaci TaxID=166011 RepID=A0A915DQJ3_9BILA
MGSRNRFQSIFANSGRSYDKQKFKDAGSKLQPVNWEGIEAYPIQKSFYQEHPTVTRRSQTEIQSWLNEHEVTLQGTNIPRPIFLFEEINFTSPIVKQLSSSGKTLGFILPGIMHTLKQLPRQVDEGPTMLVLLPTRELAQQVESVAREYCNLMNLSIACVFGGAERREQGMALRKGVDICIATPGRLLDFIDEFVTNLLRCSFLVLDEADRMLDMGFEPQIRKIVSQTRPDRQTLMFSATWPNDVRSLAMEFQTNPVFLNVGSMELSANHNIEQHVEVIDENLKPARLIQLLTFISQWPNCKTMIFVETKRKADMLNANMIQKGWPTMVIHGDKSQPERDRVMQEFRSAKSPILLATDVVSRGLDITDIKFVINYDYPKNSEDYVHRIGRTARQDNTGTSFTFSPPRMHTRLETWLSGSTASSFGSSFPRPTFENSRGKRELERDYSADSRYSSGRRTNQ